MMHFLSMVTLRRLILVFVIVNFAVSTAMAARVPRFAYIANPYDYTVTGYYVGQNGRLFPNGMAYTGDKFPASIVIHPSGKFLYAASRTKDTALIYRIDPVTGKLTETAESRFVLGVRSPFSFAFHPSGKFLYVAGRAGFISGYSVNLNTGALHPVPHAPFASGERTRCLIVHPSGKYVYATNAYTNSISAYRVDERTGELHELKKSPFFAGETGPFNEVYFKLPDVMGKGKKKGGMPYYIASDPAGKFVYVTNYAASTVSVFKVDLETGNLILQGPTVATGTEPYAVAVHPSGKYVFVTAWTKRELWVYSVNQQNGALAPVEGTPIDLHGLKPVDISFSDDGKLVYVANNFSNNASIVSFDIDTGKVKLNDFAMTRAGSIDIELLSGDKPVVIEPGYVFVLDQQHEQLLNYRVDTDTGNIHEVSHIATGKQPASIAQDPLNRFVYVANAGSNNVSAYQIDHATGKLSQVQGSPYTVGDKPSEVIVDANGWYLYTVNQKSRDMSVFLIHFTKGQLAEAQGSPVPLGKKPLHISNDATSRFIYVSHKGANTVNLYRYREAITPSIFDTDHFGSPFKFEALPSSVKSDPTGRFVIALQQQSNQVAVFYVHNASGALLPIEQNQKPFKLKGKKPVDAAFHPGGDFVYVLNQGSRTISQLKMGREYGKLSRIAKPVATQGVPRSLTMDPAGKYLYVINTNIKGLQKFSIDSKTGELSDAGNIPLDFVPAAMKISKEYH